MAKKHRPNQTLLNDAEFIRLVLSGFPLKELCTRTTLSRTTVADTARYIRQVNSAPPAKVGPRYKEESITPVSSVDSPSEILNGGGGGAPILQREERADGTATISTPRQATIRSLEELLAAAGTDLSVWTVTRHKLNTWPVGAIVDGQIATTELFQVSAWLERPPAASKLIALHDSLIASMAEHAPSYRPVKRSSREGSRVMMEFSPFDLHLGKLGWGRETGDDNYDMATAERMLIEATEHAISHARWYNPQQILFPVGNDFLHTDNSQNQTTSGTQMDADTRHTRIFEHGYRLLVNVIDRLRLIAPVTVLSVPGNHDRDSVFKLGSVLEAWYRNDGDVDIDNSPQRRKHAQWGATLIGFTHGDTERHDTLPLMLAQEFPKEWADTRFREVHLGHFHKRKETRYIAADTHTGVVVEILPSLSGTDAWHYAKGYVKTLREARTHLYDYDTGRLASITSPVSASATGFPVRSGAAVLRTR